MIQFKTTAIGYKTTLFEIDSLELNSGNVYVLVGQNGAGKSTLLKTLTKEINKIEGDILIENRPIEHISKLEISRLISFVPSQFPQLDFVSVEEFLGLGRSPHTNWIGKISESDEQVIERTINQLNINHLRSKFTSQLSDGERQLVAIGRCLTQETPIIFLDEPTAFLDYSNKEKTIQLLHKIATKENKTIVFSSHDIELSINYLTKFICIQKEDKKMIFLQSPNLKEILDISF